MCDAPALQHPTHCTNQLALQYSSLCTAQINIAAAGTQANSIFCTGTIVIPTSGKTPTEPSNLHTSCSCQAPLCNMRTCFLPTPATYRRTKLSTHRLHQAFLPPMPSFHILISPCCAVSSKPSHCYLPFPNTNVFCTKGNQADAETIPPIREML